MDKLLPCPFCGNTDVDMQFSAFQRIGDDDSKTLYDPGCMKCGASAPAAVWNKRQTLSLESVRSEALEAMQRIKDNWGILKRGESVQLTHVTEGFAQELDSGIEDAIAALSPARMAEGQQFAPAGHCAKRRADCWPCLTCWADNPSECKNP